MKPLRITAIAVVAAAFGALVFCSVSLAKAKTAPANSIDPSKQIHVSLEILSAAPGVYERVSHLPDGKAASDDQVYTALLQAGAHTLMTPQIFTAAGIPGKIRETTAVPYHVIKDGKPAVFTLNVGKAVAVDTRLLSGGSVRLGFTLTNTNIANVTKPGAAPATKTQTLSAVKAIPPGREVFVGRLKPTPGFGQQEDELVFAKVEIIKFNDTAKAPPTK